MITQILKTSLLMKQEENLILRQNDVGNDIVFLFDAKLDDITGAEFRLIKPDNTFVILHGTVADNTATFTITEQCCSIPGRCHFNLRLMNSASNIYTYVSNCIIDINLNLEDAIESTAEVNGYVFPDDFALKSEIPDTEDFATKTYVDTAIEHVPVYTPINYSFTEQKTGRKWVDGKDIYQKTYHFAESAATVEKDYNISADNVDFIISCGGCIKFGLINKWYTVPRLSGGNYIAMISANNNEITVGAREYTYTEVYATIQYTKSS